jgi:CBS domain-containing protein
MIGEICTKPALTVSPDTTVREAAHRMATQKVGALVVVGADRRPRGVITDRDITVAVVAAGRDPAAVRASQLIRRRPVVINEDAGIFDAARLLSRRGVRRLPVVDRGGKLVGLLSLDDLLILLGSEMGHIASALASELGRLRP